MVEEIEHLYYNEKKEPAEIADYLFDKQGHSAYSPPERQELIEYIETVIKSKRKS